MVVPGIVLFDDVNAEHWAKRIIRDSNREIITSQTGKAMRKVAFICMHNSCRSQIAEAAQYVPLDRLCLSTQCGFASTEEGNKLTEEQQWAKIALVQSVAKDVWGE